MAESKKKNNQKSTRNTKNNSKAKAGSSKKTPSKSSKAKGKNKKQELSFYESHRNVLMLIYLAVSVLMLCIAFIPGYNFWLRIRGGCYGFFGIGFILLAFSVLYVGIRIALSNLKRSFAVTTFFGFILSAVFSALIHLFLNSITAGGKAEWLDQLKDAASIGWDISFDFRLTGGVIGAFIGGGLLHLLGKAVAFIILTALLAIFTMLFFDISFSSLGSVVSSLINGGKNKLDDGKKIVKEKSREKHEKHKIKAEIKKKEKEEKKQREAEEAQRRKQEESDDFNFGSSEVETDFDGRNNEPERPAPPRVYNPPERLFTDFSASDSDNPNARVFERPEPAQKSRAENDKNINTQIDTDEVSSPVFPEDIEPLEDDPFDEEDFYEVLTLDTNSL